MKRRLLVVAPDEFGFRQYADDLLVGFRAAAGNDFEVLDPLFYAPVKTVAEAEALVEKIAVFRPDLVHFHHEFGWLGGRSPLRYRFCAVRRSFRKNLPSTKLVATAHGVITNEYRSTVKGKGWKAPSRVIGNLFFLPLLKRLWINETWGRLDGVIVHSRHLIPTMERSGCPNRIVLPHYVPDRYRAEDKAAQPLVLPKDRSIISIFGYFRPEKAQDLAIEALAFTKTKPFLVLGGGSGRSEDRGYVEYCEKRASELGLERDVLITGFLSWSQLDQLCHSTELVLLPFRSTTGSGSLSDLISRKAAILASAIPYNEEINERVPGAMAYFKPDDAQSLAHEIDALISDRKKIEALRAGAAQYAKLHDPLNMGRRHIDFFRDIYKSRTP